MKIHEYQAKELLRKAGAAVPRGIVVTDPDQARQAFVDLGKGKAVIKTQIHAGGRGKGRFKGSGADFGGVKVVSSADEARQVAEVMLKYPLVTKQTGEQGQRVTKLLVEEPSSITREIYVGMVIDRSVALPVLMTSAEGGVEIEEVAARNPSAILRTNIDPDRGLLPFQARRLGYDLGLEPSQVEQFETILTALVRVFLDCDASLAEINPLVVTAEGSLLALDAKMNFDDNALFRHPDIEALRDLAEENPAEVRAAKAGLSYVSMNGNIGCLVNGAGLAMSTMDIIKLHGGEPANFLDVGGGANKEQVTEALRILLSDERVKAVLVNIFGGIMKCDTIAGAILAAFQEVQPKVPFVVRLEGTNVELGRKMLAESGLKIITATDLTDAAKKVVAAAAA
ncbi:MAG: ADP-forming succinate--CoA ligase subunit beta [Gemmatales bacterium]|nr:ADP-forming succinate--CoA ligase subunit beta [Gemmatales bacterium]MDW8386687.1 ADP-forming succinate--CoA ligase subunit beta [Gemmatales bacterium]